MPHPGRILPGLLAGFAALAFAAPAGAQLFGAPRPEMPPPSLFGAPPAPPAAVAFTPAQQEVLASINAYFNAVRTMTGEFIQIGPNGEQSEGVFALARPGKIRFHYSPPAKLDVISDGGTVLIEDRTAMTQDFYPLSRTPLRHLLADRIDLTSAAIVKEVLLEPDLVSVIIAEPSMGDGWITLLFDATTFELRQWIVTDVQGFDTSVALFNTETGGGVADENFRIERWRRE